MEQRGKSASCRRWGTGTTVAPEQEGIGAEGRDTFFVVGLLSQLSTAQLLAGWQETTRSSSLNTLLLYSTQSLVGVARSACLARVPVLPKGLGA